MNTTSSVSILAATGAPVSISAPDPQSAAAAGEQRAYIALDYHNRAATLLAARDRPEQTLREAAMYAQLALNFAAVPEQMPGTLYNLARAQALLNDPSVSATFRMFREILMPSNLRQAVLNGDPDFANVSGLEEFLKARALFDELRNSSALTQMHRSIQVGFRSPDGTIGPQMAIVNRSSAEPVDIAFRNPSAMRLYNLVFRLRFVRPLALSGTDHALTLFPLARHGRSQTNDSYVVEYTFSIGPEDEVAARFELNTQAEVPHFEITADYQSPETPQARTALLVYHSPSGT